MNLNKIIRSLDLAKSDARDKTIEGIVEYILYCVNDKIDLQGLKDYIKIELSLELFNDDLIECLNNLVELGYVINDSKKYSLTSEREFELRKITVLNSTAEHKRQEQFKSDILALSPRALTSDEVNMLWSAVTDYIYECFLLHGKSALSFFNAKKENLLENQIDLKALIKKHKDNISNEEVGITFKKYIENFSQIIGVETLEYLLNLSYKAEAFFALGLSKEEYDQVYKDILFDWTVLVDTNFLYSILDLHSHSDNIVAKALLDIGTGLNISFKYLAISLKELQAKSRDFEAIIPSNLNLSQIQALVKSEKLDSFSQRYFEKKLEDMENTPHPSDIVGHAQNNLKHKKLDIYRSNFDHLTNQEEYLKIQESKFSNYLSYLDEIRAEKGLKVKGVKDLNQISHDVFLREAILHLRSSKINSISDVKYFGVTEDKTLLKFDNNETMRKNDGLNIPVFFSPSTLLKKLLKYSPVQSDDYKRAFINTISSPALENNTTTSKIAIRSVKYFHNMGISDERMILNCIKDEIFLYKFRDLETKQEELSEFVESHLQQQFTHLNTQYEASVHELEGKSKIVIDLSDNLNETEALKNKLENKLDSINDTLKVYEKTLKNLKQRNSSKTDSSHQLTLDDQLKVNHNQTQISQVKEENLLLQKQIEALEHSQQFKTWQFKSLWFLIPIAIILILISLSFGWQDSSWNFVAALTKTISTETTFNQDLCKVILGILISFTLIFPSNIIYKRFYSNSTRNDFFQTLK